MLSSKYAQLFFYPLYYNAYTGLNGRTTLPTVFKWIEACSYFNFFVFCIENKQKSWLISLICSQHNAVLTAMIVKNTFLFIV